MTWNYRVVRACNPDGVFEYAIHEAYYADGKVSGWTENPASVAADHVGDLMTVLERMTKALELPVIDAVNGREVELSISAP